MFFLPLWIMSLESPCQAQFLGFDSNDGARTQVARQVDLELQGSVENSVVFAERNLPLLTSFSRRSWPKKVLQGDLVVVLGLPWTVTSPFEQGCHVKKGVLGYLSEGKGEEERAPP